MSAINLSSLATEQLDVARAASSGRTAKTLYGGRERQLRQTMLAITAGRSLGEHDSPGEATLQVILGNVVLSDANERWTLAAGDYIEIPAERHNLEAIDDSVVILTVKVG